MKKVFFSLALLGALSGCAGFQQAVSGDIAVVATGDRALHDNEVAAWKLAACDITIGAIARHPEIADPVNTLCLAPEGQTTVQQLMKGAAAARKP